ncbi:MAG: hypothetical protein JXA54_01155 [Candidatus Heimdallarchaeota archaeon]|nr:hypothetical protein [Candidatus Heimdallarchaeota archaeon]
MKICWNMYPTTIKRMNILTLLLLIVISNLILNTQNYIFTTNAASEEDAYSTITTAYETIEQASQEGLDVTSYIARLNDALNDYFLEEYTSAYNKALLIIEDVNNNLQIYKRNRAFTYIIIPFNLLIVAALIAILGMKMIKWHNLQSDEEFLDMQIVYPDEKSSLEL